MAQPLTKPTHPTIHSSRDRGGWLTHVADLAYRRRVRMLLAWVVLFAVVVAVAPRLAGDFSSEFETAGSESQRAARLVGDRFSGISGDSINVVWHANAGARDPSVLARVQRFLQRAERLEGITSATPASVSP